MLIAIDIGNSRTKICLFRGSRIASLVSFDTCSAEYAKAARDAVGFLLKHNNLSVNDISGIAISSVVPSCTKRIESFCMKTLVIPPMVISAHVNVGITIRYKTPFKLGADRICNAAAAFHKHSGPVIVVDWGTTTKFEVVDKRGNYLGGVIAPGAASSARMLTEHTALLPLVDLDLPQTVIGKDTNHCIQSGILYGIIELTNGLLTRIKKELGGKPYIIGTGGFSSLFARHVKGIDSIEPHLVLEGSRIIYERNICH